LVRVDQSPKLGICVKLAYGTEMDEYHGFWGDFGKGSGVLGARWTGDNNINREWDGGGTGGRSTGSGDGVEGRQGSGFGLPVLELREG